MAVYSIMDIIEKDGILLCGVVDNIETGSRSVVI